MSLDPELLAVLGFLRRHPEVRGRLAAPPDKTVVYSGGVHAPDGIHAGWRLLAQAKAKEPRRFDDVTLEERLRRFHCGGHVGSIAERSHPVRPIDESFAGR